MRRLVPLLAAFWLPFFAVPAPAQEHLAPQATAVVNIIAVGQGDAILIRSPEGKTALIDAGPSKDIVPALKRLGVTTIDLIAVSHHHADHYGGMDDVIREFHPRVFLATNTSHTTPTYLALLKLVRDSGMQASTPTATARKVELGSVILTILPQPPEDLTEENNNSIGLRVQHGSFNMLLTGDSEDAERAWWMRHCPDLLRDCDVLKLAHHGSENGTDAAWLSLVKPKLAVASMDKDNQYGHPDPETLALLERARVPLLRTDLHGTITIKSDGKNWQVVGFGQVVRGPPAITASFAERPDAQVKPSRTIRLIDINTATQEELESLPGIGPTIARRIIEGRPYRLVNDLLRVDGIGVKKLEEIRGQIGVRRD